MKKSRITVICLLLTLLILLSAGCERQQGESSAPTNVPPSDGRLVASENGMRLIELCVASDVKATEVLSVTHNFACVCGEYKGQSGMFFVSADGKVLGDYVFDRTLLQFEYRNGEGYYVLVCKGDSEWYELS